MTDLTRCRDGGAKDNLFSRLIHHCQNYIAGFYRHNANETGDFGSGSRRQPLFGSAGFASDAIARNLRHLPRPLRDHGFHHLYYGLRRLGENICRGAGAWAATPLLSNTPEPRGALPFTSIS